MSALFSFGIISDVQYADEDDSFNFHKTSKRYYRKTLTLVDEAVQEWNNENIEFVLQIGDLIDGKCSEYPDRALANVLDKFKPLKVPLYHVLGNHELYNFERKELQKWFGTEFNYEISPYKGYRIVVLNSFERSVIWKNEEDFVEHCYSYFEPFNPNCVRSEENWVKGLSGVDKRFVPYNGGISEDQMQWFENILENSKKNNEFVIVVSHCPLQEDCSCSSTLLWNYQDVLKIIEKYKEIIVCCLYGHDHAGGYCLDSNNIHHLTLPSPLESKVGSNAFATLDVYEDKIEIRGRGDIISQTWPLVNKTNKS